jgi:mannose-6-phosphate isomerase-like protein (cupin superfamily)
MTVKAISLASKHAEFSKPWSPKRIARINEFEVKLAKAEGAFDWHLHEEEDEFFLVTRGMLRIDIEDQESVFLGAGECCVILAGVRHRPVAEAPEVHLMFIERAGTVNTGDNEESDLRQEVEDI